MIHSNQGESPGDRVIGLLVLRERQIKPPEEEGTRPMLCVEACWVARQERRKAHATAMIRAVEQRFNRRCSDFVYMAPLSFDGDAFLVALGLNDPLVVSGV